MKKRLLVLALTLCMALCLLPVGARAAEVVDSGTCGANVSWKLTNDGVLTISGIGRMAYYPLNTVSPWFSYLKDITAINVAEGLTSVSGFGFCTNLQTVSLPESLLEIDAYAFNNCSSISKITIPPNVNKVGERAFYNCTQLKEVEAPGVAYKRDSFLGRVNDVFLGCEKIERIVVTKGAIPREAFCDMDCIKSVTMYDEASGVGSRAFYNCDSLVEIIISGKGDIESEAFAECDKLEKIIMHEKAPGIFRRAFYNCDSLTDVTVLGQGNIGEEAFAECDNLENVTIATTYNNDSGEIIARMLGPRVFFNCFSLQTIKFVGNDGGPWYFNNTFENITAMVYYPNTWHTPNSNYGGNITWVPYGVNEVLGGSCGKNTTWQLKDGCLTIQGNGLMNTYSEVKRPPWYQYRLDIEEVIISEGVINIHGFFDCINLKCVTIPEGCKEIDGNIVRVVNIGFDSFANCPSLCEITFLGGPPDFYGEPLLGVTATAYYPSSNELWSTSKHNYGGNITWVPYSKPAEEPPRIAGDNRFETANLVADQIKQNLGIEKFDAVVVASGTEFADALAGSYLAAVKKAPILLAYSKAEINNDVKEYILENLNEGGTVYILGGLSAINAPFEEGLEGFEVKRLAGQNRFETNLLILKEAGVGDSPILIATGLTFADSLSASATKLPILLVYGDKLLDEQVAFLEENKGRSLYLLGGEGAVSKKMEDVLNAYGTVERVAGSNRFETSVKIAETFFTNPETAVLSYAWGFPDGLCGGPLAAAMNAPLILTMDKYESRAAEYIQGNAILSGTILGGEGLISEATVNNIFN